MIDIPHEHMSLSNEHLFLNTTTIFIRPESDLSVALSVWMTQWCWCFCCWQLDDILVSTWNQLFVSTMYGSIMIHLGLSDLSDLVYLGPTEGTHVHYQTDARYSQHQPVKLGKSPMQPFWHRVFFKTTQSAPSHTESHDQSGEKVDTQQSSWSSCPPCAALPGSH